ncbi:MAG: hypothetical protein NT113_04275 [Hyphomicrobiales bacterium]|jgi:hydroxymethylpyrimidine pyrophosphatase-like HAD family hydrolase|nr:hypothetical protein [Hyphomicrobiales bacterium]
MTPVFSSKLDSLVDTVELACRNGHGFLAEAMERAAAYPVAAVGSGGSVVAAEFLSSCRSWLQHAPTAVCTPMAFVLDPVLPQWGVWLFSASGDNPDVQAAFRAATTEHAERVDVVTNRKNGAVAMAGVARRTPRVHVLPTAEAKDGFLATHSLVSTVTSLLLASDDVVGELSDARTNEAAGVAKEVLAVDARKVVHGALSRMGASSCDTLLLLHDPGLAAAASMIETSCWEAGLCAVQRTDFRNFAHGRHVWLAHSPEKTFVLALTCDRTREIWASIAEDIPVEVARGHFDFGPAGRFGLFSAVLRSFAIVEGIGRAKGIDPGKPAVGDFGRRLFARQDLLSVVEREDAATRRKWRAEIRSDRQNRAQVSWPAKREVFVREFENAKIGGVVLDYDGTVVPTQRRLDAPDAEILAMLVRWISSGLVVAFATGRGGSVGEMLRTQLPSEFWRRIIMGYYNGAHIAPLTVDLEQNPPEPDPVIGRMFAEICSISGLFKESWLPKRSPFQITVQIDKLASPAEGARKLREIVGRYRETRIFRSGHSLDICPAWGGKWRVVEHVKGLLPRDDSAVLTIGDSGDRQGNDHELLTGNFGLSVDRVCDRTDSCWNLLPPGVSGPSGLLRILGALRETDSRRARLDVSALFGT